MSLEQLLGAVQKPEVVHDESVLVASAKLKCKLAETDLVGEYQTGTRQGEDPPAEVSKDEPHIQMENVGGVQIQVVAAVEHEDRSLLGSSQAVGVEEVTAVQIQ